MKTILATLLVIIAPCGASADGFGFQTPSGNIYCNGWVSNDGAISCTIINKSSSPPLPRPSSCAGLWGHDFYVEGSGRSGINCRADYPEPVDYTDVAPFGVSADFGDIICTSERTGLTCRNKDGHGFFLSRKKQKVF